MRHYYADSPEMEGAFLSDAQILSKPTLYYELVWAEGRFFIRLSLHNHKQSLHAEFTLLHGEGAEAEALAEGLAEELIAKVKKAARISSADNSCGLEI